MKKTKKLVSILLVFTMLMSLATVVSAQQVPTDVRFGCTPESDLNWKAYQTCLSWNKVEGMPMTRITLYKGDEVVEKIFLEIESDTNRDEYDLWDLIEANGYGRYSAIVEVSPGTLEDFDYYIQRNMELEMPMTAKSERSNVFEYTAAFKYTGSMFGGDEDDENETVVETKPVVTEQIPAPVVTSKVTSLAETLPTPQIIRIGDINNSLFTVVEEVDKFSAGKYLLTIAKARTRSATTPVDYYDLKGDVNSYGEPIEREHKYFDGYTAKDILEISFKNNDQTEQYYKMGYFNKTDANSPNVRWGMNTYYNYGYVQLFSDRDETYCACYNPFNNVLYMYPGQMSSINDDGTALLQDGDKVYKVQFKPTVISVLYDGKRIGFDQLPVIENGRTLVPLRAIFEKIGATVEWDGETQTVIAKSTENGTIIRLTIDSTTAIVNGVQVGLDVPAKIINGRTLVPVRFVSDCFGVGVDWNGDIQSVILTSK